MGSNILSCRDPTDVSTEPLGNQDESNCWERRGGWVGVLGGGEAPGNISIRYNQYQRNQTYTLC